MLRQRSSQTINATAQLTTPETSKLSPESCMSETRPPPVRPAPEHHCTRQTTEPARRTDPPQRYRDIHLESKPGIPDRAFQQVQSPRIIGGPKSGLPERADHEFSPTASSRLIPSSASNAETARLNAKDERWDKGMLIFSDTIRSLLDKSASSEICKLAFLRRLLLCVTIA